MNQFFLSIALALCLGVPAISEISVRSGEHPTFSRLVMRIPTGVEWQLEEKSSGYELRLEDYGDGFDISGVFDLIPRTRLSDLIPGESSLDLVLECQCVVSETMLDNGYLVLDISQGVRGAFRADTGRQLHPIPDRTEFSTARAASDIREPVLPVVLPQSSLDRQLPTPERLTERRERLDDFRQSLLQQLSRAGTQNLLELPQIETPEVASVDEPEEIARPVLEAPDTPKERLTVTTAQDDALADPLARVVDLPVQCHPSPYYDVASWGGEGGFYEAQADIRTDLYGEFDQVSEDKALQLVRLYLHYGLAAEVDQMLRAFGLDSDASLALQQMADILSGDSLAPDDPLPNMLECSGEVAMWAALAGGDVTISTASAERIAPVFSSLTADLRQLIGPKLIRAFNESGREVAADITRAALDRIAGKDSEDEIKTRLLSGDEDIEVKELELIVEKNDEHAPLALARMVETQLSEQNLIDPDTIDLVGGFSQQLAGTPMGDALRELELRAISRRGQFELAQDRAWAELNPSQQEAVTGALVADVLNEGRPSDIAVMAKKLLQRDLAAFVEEDMLRDLRSYLVSYGLTDLAEDLGDITGTEDVATDLAIQLERRAYDEALRTIEEIPEQAGAALAADLRFLSGQADAAWQARQNDQTDDPSGELYAWRAEAWEDVEGDGATAVLAEQITEPPILLGPDRPLEQSQAILQNSQAARDAIEALISGQN